MLSFLAFAAASVAVDYAKPANWLCLPGRNDACSTPLPVTPLLPNGYGPPTTRTPAKNPPLDCFYVYPTVSNDDAANSGLASGGGEETAAARAQIARFASACRIYAPAYRQMTVRTVTLAGLGRDVGGPARVAYGDVAGAFHAYLARENHGRRFVLIGHSQGSLMLQLLIAREIDGQPLARQLALAIIPGFDVLVPQGKLVGGTFKSIPLCSKPGETGCVMSWSSYREHNVPPDGAMFGFANQPGMTVGCVNPGRVGASGWIPLDSLWNTRLGAAVPGGPIDWSSTGPPPSTFLSTAGLVSARCVNDGPRGYLSIRTNADPGDARTDRIGGEVGMMGFFLPGWGMHLNDLAAPEDDLVAIVARLGAATPRPAALAR